MYGGKLDGVYSQSIDRFWNWLFILVGQYVISYCLKGEKVTQRKENSNFDSATATALKQGQVKEFSKQKILSNILTCKLKKGLG